VGVPALREAGELNEPLRRALLRARLREDDVAARLGVDPKTVRRWLTGRIPYASNRAALADLVGVDEADLWPDAEGPLAARPRPEELGAIYPHRWSVPREVWTRFFASAEQEIGILAYSALFLAEDAGILHILADKGRSGVKIRIALGDPNSTQIAACGEEDGIRNALPAKIRSVLNLYGPLREISNIEVRLHQIVLYNSIYRADNRLLINQHVYGIPAAHAPVFSIQVLHTSDIATAYLESFERVWITAETVQEWSS
jgi:transcriptional regulator with XRE-family HTH domain